MGFYKTKTKHLLKLAKLLENKRVPDNLAELLKLPGIGRKSANLILTEAFEKEGICVDVHVNRVVNRWGYVKTKNPEETEIRLREKLPKKYWRKINYLLVAYGQNICRPISPKCVSCKLNSWCNSQKTYLKD